MHEQVDISKALSCKVLWQGLGDLDGSQDSVLDSNNKSLLLFGVGSDAESCKQLPDVAVLARRGSARKDMGKCWLQNVEKVRVVCLPVQFIVSMMAILPKERKSKDIPSTSILSPDGLSATGGLDHNLGTAQNHGQETNSNTSPGDEINVHLGAEEA